MKERNGSSRLLGNQPCAWKYRLHLLFNREKLYYSRNRYPTGVTTEIVNGISLSDNFKDFSVFTEISVIPW